MTTRQQSSVKRAQKESLIQHLLASFLLQTLLDDKRLAGLSITRVKLSPDKSVCTVFFHTYEGEEKFNEQLKMLILYKPSMRKAVADSVQSRYVPELIFKYDTSFDKQQHIDEILLKIKDEES